MTHADALAYLGTRLDYERRGMPDSRELRLDRMECLLDALGRPERQYPVIHIAGTKGKGSTAHMIARMLEANGRRVGLHSSPHLHEVEERFQVNGRPIDRDVFASLIGELVPFVETVDRRLADQPGLTYFEVTTALMLLHFARAEVDAAVVEVGMGGRLDSTNVVDPAVAVITTISMDHAKQLGDTLEAIAGEKAGIVKRGRPVVAGVRQPGPRAVIAAVAQSQGCELRQVDRDFSVAFESRGGDGGSATVKTWRRDWPTISLPTIGAHQAQNAGVACAVFDVLDGLGWTLDPARAAAALAGLRLPARIEIVARLPWITIVDSAHNDASALALRESLESAFGVRGQSSKVGPRALLYATSRDKDWRTILETLAPAFDWIVVTGYQNNPRALEPEPIAEALLERGREVEVASAPAVALEKAQAFLRDAGNAPGVGLLCVAGSFYLAAEIREILQKK